jgi:hypothetical protein
MSMLTYLFCISYSLGRYHFNWYHFILFTFSGDIEICSGCLSKICDVLSRYTIKDAREFGSERHMVLRCASIMLSEAQRLWKIQVLTNRLLANYERRAIQNLVTIFLKTCNKGMFLECSMRQRFWFGERKRGELGGREGTHYGFEQVEMSERWSPLPSPWALI